MRRKLFCPKCKKEVRIILERNVEPYDVLREGVILVDGFVAKCSICNTEILDIYWDGIRLKKAYRIYKEKHGLLQSWEIKEIRRKLNLTISQFANELGVSEKYIIRIENGLIQSEIIDQKIKSISKGASYEY